MNVFSDFGLKLTIQLIIFALLGAGASESLAQRPRFSDFFQSQPTVPVQQVSSPQLPGPTVGAPAPVIQGPQLVSPGLQAAPPPGAIIAPAFDPFQSNVQPLPFSTAPTGSIEVLPPTVQNPPGSLGQPLFQTPAQTAPQFGQPFPGSSPNTQSGSQFPRATQTGSFWERFRSDFLPRLLEQPRFRHTWVAGNNGNELQMHDSEFATTLTLPRFLFLQQPFRITPSFIAHFWTGPETAGEFGTGFDLPAQAFSAFLNMDYLTDPCRQAGLETSLSVGAYSDYSYVNSDSVRVTGVLLGWARLNSTNVFKLGFEYFDRLEVKMLPAFGLFIRPTSDLELDLYFPRPRIAQRLRNIGDREVWGYIAGEYGGGSWTVSRLAVDERIDINDYRAILGIEWVGPRGVNGFFETGYVFNREMVSEYSIPSRELQLEDSIMLRMGLAF